MSNYLNIMSLYRSLYVYEQYENKIYKDIFDIDWLFKYKMSLYVTLYVYEQYENEIYDFFLFYWLDFQYLITKI